MAEVEQSVIVAGRPANEHILEHLLDSAWRTAIANEIGTKLTLRRAPERHVVPQDLDLFPALDNRCQPAGRRGWFDGIIQLNIRKLVPANETFLCYRGTGIPSLQIATILVRM